MITLRFISIRPGLIAQPGLSVSVLQIPQETLTSMFQAKLKEKSPALPCTWLVGQILTKSYHVQGTEGQHEFCMCSYAELHQSQRPSLCCSKFPSLATGRSERWMTASAELSVLTVC